MKTEKCKKPNRQGRSISFWLGEDDIKRLKKIAQEKGVGHTTLVRMWVKEKLKDLKLNSNL